MLFLTTFSLHSWRASRLVPMDHLMRASSCKSMHFPMRQQLPLVQSLCWHLCELHIPSWELLPLGLTKPTLRMLKRHGSCFLLSSAACIVYLLEHNGRNHSTFVPCLVKELISCKCSAVKNLPQSVCSVCVSSNQFVCDRNVLLFHLSKVPSPKGQNVTVPNLEWKVQHSIGMDQSILQTRWMRKLHQPPALNSDLQVNIDNIVLSWCVHVCLESLNIICLTLLWCVGFLLCVACELKVINDNSSPSNRQTTRDEMQRTMS